MESKNSIKKTGRCTVSIVTFKNDKKVILKTILCCLKSNDIRHLYIIDNSPTDVLRSLILDSRIIYIHNPSNPGFGASHNISIYSAIEAKSLYHFIVNPDIFFDNDVFKPMIDFMEQNPRVGMMMPQILNPDGSIQYLPKLLPSPFTVIWRKIKFPRNLYNKFINNYELRFVNNLTIHETPIISGCFTLIKLNAIKEIGGYDDSFFMYFEDWDLSRRMYEKFQTIHFPLVSVYHEYHSGANKSFKLFKIYLKSAFHYFNKWGWFIDKKRKVSNYRSLTQFK